MSNTPKRIQRKRAKGWKMPPGAVYVGRPTPYGNLYRVGDGLCSTADDAVAFYRQWIETGENYVNDTPPPDIADIRRELRGRDLACWCAPGQLCHADVLLEIANAPDDEVTP
jgi:hypothetical protein